MSTFDQLKKVVRETLDELKAILRDQELQPHREVIRDGR